MEPHERGEIVRARSTVAQKKRSGEEETLGPLNEAGRAVRGDSADSWA